MEAGRVQEIKCNYNYTVGRLKQEDHKVHGQPVWVRETSKIK